MTLINHFTFKVNNKYPNLIHFYSFLCDKLGIKITDPTLIFETAPYISKGISYICLTASDCLSVKNNIVYFGQNEKKFHNGKDLIKFVSSYLTKFSDNQKILPFIGGFAGYIGFDFIAYYENLEFIQEDELNIPDLQMYFFDSLVAIDYINNKIHVLSSNYNRNTDLLFQEIKTFVIEYLSSVDNGSCNNDNFNFVLPKNLPELEKKIDRKHIHKSVRAITEHIMNGGISQGVPSFRVKLETHKTGIEIYKKLQQINPTPYMFYMNAVGSLNYELFGASPELLFKYIKDSSHIETRAIAGTRRRGVDTKEDTLMEKDLLNDIKEIAEYSMLVDLARNDIGRVAKVGSVRVEDYMKVEKFSNVMHIVSKITGELHQKYTPFDALLSVFPTGTVTGAPKIEAMKLISTLENVKRNFYSGGIGYFSLNGNVDVCILIRACLKAGDVCHIQAGMGVVSESEPEKETKEVFNKLKGIASAILD